MCKNFCVAYAVGYDIIGSGGSYMANNRMWLRCRSCGGLYLLGKVFGGGYSSYYENMTATFDEFANEHEYCGDVHYENQFELVYDHAIDEGIKEDQPGDKIFNRPFNYKGGE